MDQNGHQFQCYKLQLLTQQQKNNNNHLGFKEIPGFKACPLIPKTFV